MTIPRARPTVYAGIQMRSRLEASFAEMLDNDGDLVMEWSYEGRCFASKDGQYLPDFIVYWAWRDDWEYCEVKPPSADLDAALARMHIILASEPLARLFVWTLNPNPIDNDIFYVPLGARCTPDLRCGKCDREKLPAGYERP